MFARVASIAVFALCGGSVLACQKSKPEDVAPVVQPPAPPATQPPAPASASPPPLASSVAADNKAVAAQFVSGVGQPEGTWVWTLGRTFAVDLGVPPDAKQSGGKILARFAIHDNMIKKNGSLTVSARAGSASLPAQTYKKGGTAEYSAAIPANDLQSDRVHVEFTLDKGFKPGNEELGVMLFGVTLSPG
jgi:hypothetical protein